MANYGLELYNAKGFVVASAGLGANYTLRAAGTINNNQFTPGAKDNSSSCYINLSGFNCPIVFVRPMNADQRVSVVLENSEQFANSTQYKPNRVARFYKWYNKNVGTVQYYIFDRWTPPERAQGYGMQMWDAGGTLTFDSSWHFLKLRSVRWLDPGFPNHGASAAGANWTDIGAYGAGTLAVAMPYTRSYIYPTGVFGAYMTECMHFEGANNNVKVSIIPRGFYLDMIGNLNGWVQSAGRSLVMVADVAGLPTNYNALPVTKG